MSTTIYRCHICERETRSTVEPPDWAVEDHPRGGGPHYFCPLHVDVEGFDMRHINVLTYSGEWSRFKVAAGAAGRSTSEGLRKAISDFTDKHLT